MVKTPWLAKLPVTHSQIGHCPLGLHTDNPGAVCVCLTKQRSRLQKVSSIWVSNSGDCNIPGAPALEGLKEPVGLL